MTEIYLNNMPAHNKTDIIGLFGGSFNPPHSGHLLVAKQAIKRLNLTQLWWMVSPGNPLKDNSNLPSIETRVRWSGKLLQKQHKIMITAFEETIKSWTSFDTINYILNAKKKAKFIWIMGGDSLENFDKWYNWQMIAELIPICIIKRPMMNEPQKKSNFAKKYHNSFVNSNEAYNLAFKNPPAWCYIEDAVSYESSTNLR